MDRVIVLADDFTGATDVASAFADTGRKVRTWTSDEAINLKSPGYVSDVDVEVVALKSRSCPPDEAIELMKESLRRLGYKNGSDQIYFKYCSTFDSTPQGNIGPCLDFLVKVTGDELPVVVPAFPDNCRTQYCGYLFVSGKLLSETHMANHPLTPMRDSSVIRLLESQSQRPCELVRLEDLRRGALRKRFEQKPNVGASLVIDAITNSDIQIIAKSVSQRTLVSGGSALAQWYPKIGDSTRIVAEASANDEGLILVGSRSEMTQKQLAYYVSQQGQRLIEIDPGNSIRDEVARLVKEIEVVRAEGRGTAPIVGRPVIFRGDQGQTETSTKIESVLANLAVQFRNSGGKQLIVAGGETSGAILQALGVIFLEIGQNIAPGVSWSKAHLQSGDDMSIALKSGNFGDEKFFVDSWSVLN